MSVIATIREKLDGVTRLLAGRKTVAEVRDAKEVLDVRIATERDRLTELQDRKREALKRQIRGEIGGDDYADLDAQIDETHKSLTMLEASAEEVDQIVAEMAEAEREAALQARMNAAAASRTEALGAYSELSKLLPRVVALVETIRASDMKVAAANAEVRVAGRGELSELDAFNWLNAVYQERIRDARTVHSVKGSTPVLQMIGPMMNPAGHDLRIPGYWPPHESFRETIAAARF